MRLQIRFAEQIVGLFVILAVVGVAAVLVLIGVNQRWFARDYQFFSRFNSADGLSPGMPITLKGFEIGKTNSITLNDDNSVELGFVIFDTYYEKVKPNSVIELATNPLGLGGGLQFHPGRNDFPPIREGTLVPSLGMRAARDLVNRGLVDKPADVDEIGELIASVGSLVSGLDGAVRGDQEGPIGQMLVQLVSITAEIQGVVGEAQGVIGQVRSLAGEVQEVGGQARTVLASIDGVVQRLDTVAGNLTAVSDNLAVATGEMRDPTGLATRLIDPKGSVARFLDDDEALYGRVDGALIELNAIIAQLGEVASYVNRSTPQISGLLEESRNTLERGQDVLEGLSNNPLLRGGITREAAQPNTVQGFRDEDF